MGKRISGKKVEQSSFFKRARASAVEYLKSPGKLNRLVDRAMQKIYHRQGPFTEFRESLQASFRLLRAWASGRYREIPTASLISIIASTIYFVMPVDVIPDFLLGFGLIDDAALFGWILSSLKTDIEHFIAWEREKTEAGKLESAPHDDEPEC